MLIDCTGHCLCLWNNSAYRKLCSKWMPIWSQNLYQLTAGETCRGWLGSYLEKSPLQHYDNYDISAHLGCRCMQTTDACLLRYTNIHIYIDLIIKTAYYTGTGVRWWTIDIHSLPTHTTCCQKPVNQCSIFPVTLDTSRSSSFQQSPTTDINCLNKNIPQTVSGWTNPLEKNMYVYCRCASQLRSFLKLSAWNHHPVPHDVTCMSVYLERVRYCNHCCDAIVFG